jgi:hypothetical protein
MQHAEVRKGKNGIDDVVRGHSGQVVDSERRLESTADAEFEELLKVYDQVLYTGEFIDGKRRQEYVRFMVNDVLTPSEINSFLQATKPWQEKEVYKNWTGRVISQLIQNSYDAGHNDFVLNTKDLAPISVIATEVVGKDDDHVRLWVEGGVGSSCGLESEYLTINIAGDAATHLGEKSKHSTFNVEGSAESYCGQRAEESSFNIAGNGGYACGDHAKKSTFNIEGDVGLSCGEKAHDSVFRIMGKISQNSAKKTFSGKKAIGCTFKSPHKEMCTLLRWDVYRFNELYRIMPDGTEAKWDVYGSSEY